MRLHFRHYGSGEPLIILHGLFGSLNNWNTLAQRISEKFSVFAVDQRNHGRSPHSAVHTYPAMAGDVREFMDQHGLDRAHLLGHSMGGKTAMEVALGTPDHVQSLIVVDIAPAAYPPGHDTILEALSRVNVHAFDSREAIDAALRERIPEERVRQFLLTNLKRTEEGGLDWKMDLEALRKNYDAMNSGLSSGRRYDGPALVIRGEHSHYVLPEHEKVFREMFPRVRFETINGAGHWVHADQPEAFLTAVMQFLGGGTGGN